MTKNNDFQTELKAKVKEGIKPSDLKTMPKNPFKKNTSSEIEKLENEKTELLKQLENYEKEQKIAVTTFKKQERELAKKEQDLVKKDEELTAQQEQIKKLKDRIHELFKDKQEKVLVSEVITENKSIQTTGTNSEDLEEQLLEKKVSKFERI